MATINKSECNNNFIYLQPQSNENDVNNAFLSLPNEMLFQIFQYSINSIEDIKNLSLVCRKFCSIASSPICWKEVFSQDLAKLFFAAINKGDVETALCLKENARNAKEIATVKISDRLGRTPLMRAVEIGNLEIVKFLIENGAQINADNGADNDATGVPPLRRTALNYAYALERNNADIIKYLIEKGAKYLWGPTLSHNGLMYCYRWGMW